ncbi:hypothetical protein [Kineococcus aurantiacus]|uniref:Uncharacterized protein n=1 Tax=Kineococcus aurantiacus TaxID=37633 RepID=A0A7Y9J2K5_9ACTN|nr:hypothetical protein [Kineococcus aurantiacus]NYD24245.1 hypothetical protein [Kineococcus aurantiacus]
MSTVEDPAFEVRVAAYAARRAAWIRDVLPAHLFGAPLWIDVP